MKHTSSECSLIRQIILKSLLQELSQEESIRLKGHLAICPDCRAFQYNFLNLNKALAVNVNDLPLAGLDLYPELQQKVREIKFSKRKAGYILIERIIKTFRQPVPLYQAALVFIFVFCIAAFVMSNFDKKETTTAASANMHYRPDSSIVQYINYYPSISVLPVKLGINAAEDTSFKSILFSAM